MSSVVNFPVPVSPAEINRAQLPELYQAARRALSACDKLDECKHWSNYSYALASYARQARDEAMLRFAQRIKARALRRAGEVLKKLPPHRNQWGEQKTGKPSRKQAAMAAGLSHDQARRVLRIAALPEAVFDRAIDGKRPATMQKLERLGTRKRVIVDTEAVRCARAQVQLKKLLRESEDLAADIATIETAPAYFQRLLKRDVLLRAQLKHALLFFNQVLEWGLEK